MIHLSHRIKGITAVACSGGVDSMAALSFIRKSTPNVVVIYFDHGTEHSETAEQFLRQYCSDHQLQLLVGQVQEPWTQGESWEAYWRTQRYNYFHSLKEHTIATAHHLNDLAETYLMGCMHGKPRFIGIRNRNVVRPFLLTKKAALVDWCDIKEVPYIQDPSNSNERFARNRTRHSIMPEVLRVNPGFLTTVSKLFKKRLAYLLKKGTNFVAQPPDGSVSWEMHPICRCGCPLRTHPGWGTPIISAKDGKIKSSLITDQCKNCSDCQGYTSSSYQD